MYEAFFQLQRRPFPATPDIACCLPTDNFQHCLTQLLRAVDAGQGIGVLTATAGLGKTLLARKLVNAVREKYTPILCNGSGLLSRRGVVQTLLYELGEAYSGFEEEELRLGVLTSLKRLVQSGRGAVVIIDEAHLLPHESFEELRSLIDISENGQPLCRLVLIGELLLEEKLTYAEYAALSQRIACHTYLERMTREETVLYIACRMEWAGSTIDATFTTEALQLIAQVCDGIPRLINQLCDHSLLLAYVAGSLQVTPNYVQEALNDLKQLPLRWNIPLSLEGGESQISAELTAEVVAVPAEESDGAEPVEGSQLGVAPGETASIEVGGPEAEHEWVTAVERLEVPSNVHEPLSALPPVTTGMAAGSEDVVEVVQERIERNEEAGARDNEETIAFEAVETEAFETESLEPEWAGMRVREAEELMAAEEHQRLRENSALDVETYVTPATVSAVEPADVAESFRGVVRMPVRVGGTYFQEEVLVDRYAWLDAGRTDVPEIVREQPARLGRDADDDFEPRGVDAACEPEEPTLRYPTPTESLEERVEGWEPERQVLEEEVGAAAMEACLEVQEALEGKRDLAEDRIEPVTGMSWDDGAPERRYDAVRPAAAECVGVERGGGDERRAVELDRGHQPSYKRLFSLLRRKQGGRGKGW